MEQSLPLSAFYKGWDVYQRDLVNAVAPLSPEQLALPVAATHWPIGMLVQHILNDRIWWFNIWMGEGAPRRLPLCTGTRRTRESRCIQQPSWSPDWRPPGA